jgi:Leucine-rich repeat (LRR) protein
MYELHCGDTGLTALPELPETLTVLGCGNNQLTTLPELPETLIYIELDFDFLGKKK